MVMADALLANGCTHGEIPSTLSRDIYNGTVANNVPSPSRAVNMVRHNILDYSTVMCIYSADMIVNSQYSTYLLIFIVLFFNPL